MREKCGVFGIYTQKKSYKTIQNVIQGLELLQHRGQESCGIAYEQNDSLFCQTTPGLVKNALKDIKILGEHFIKQKHWTCQIFNIGSSKTDVSNLHSESQPLYGKCKLGGFFLAHNGNVPNLNEHESNIS